MNKKIRVSFRLVVTLMLLVGGCIWQVSQGIDSGSWEPMAEVPNFYTKTDYEGWTTLGYSSYWWKQPEPLLSGFYDFCRENHNVVGYDIENDLRITLNMSAQSRQEAEASLARSAATAPDKP